jgi:23S rRNA pseudouridine2605 synthase
VRVNGLVATVGQSADPARDRITIDGKRVGPARDAWIALHKPVGYVVSRRDPEGRPTVFSLVPEVPGLTYVGRLDVMTSGLLLLTTDGEAANRLTHPRYGVERTYRALVHGRRPEEIKRLLERPVVIDRRPVRVTEVLVRPGERGATDLRLSLAEGRYRIVRRVCEHLGLKVARLTRLSHGPVRLGRLPPGKWRYLSRAEVAAIAAAGG